MRPGPRSALSCTGKAELAGVGWHSTGRASRACEGNAGPGELGPSLYTLSRPTLSPPRFLERRSQRVDQCRKRTDVIGQFLAVVAQCVEFVLRRRIGYGLASDLGVSVTSSHTHLVGIDRLQRRLKKVCKIRPLSSLTPYGGMVCSHAVEGMSTALGEGKRISGAMAASTSR